MLKLLLIRYKNNQSVDKSIVKKKTPHNISLSRFKLYTFFLNGGKLKYISIIQST